MEDTVTTAPAAVADEDFNIFSDDDVNQGEEVRNNVVGIVSWDLVMCHSAQTFVSRIFSNITEIFTNVNDDKYPVYFRKALYPKYNQTLDKVCGYLHRPIYVSRMFWKLSSHFFNYPKGFLI